LKDRPARRHFEAHSDQDRSGAIFICHLAIVATASVLILAHKSQRLRAPAGLEKIVQALEHQTCVSAEGNEAQGRRGSGGATHRGHAGAHNQSLSGSAWRQCTSI